MWKIIFVLLSILALLWAVMLNIGVRFYRPEWTETQLFLATWKQSIPGIIGAIYLGILIQSEKCKK